MGDASTPPTSIASSTPISMLSPPSEKISEPADTTATATSAVFTDPTANRGDSPRCSRNGVTTGPHAPIKPFVMPPAVGRDLDAARVERRHLVGVVLEVVGFGHRLDHLRLESPEDAQADEDQQAGEHRFDRLAVDVGEHGDADQRPECARDREVEDQLVVDVAEPPVRDARRDAGGDLGQVDGRGHRGRRDAGREQDARRRSARTPCRGLHRRAMLRSPRSRRARAPLHPLHRHYRSGRQWLRRRSSQGRP